MSSGDESDTEPVSTDILEDICDVSQYHPSTNRREARYKIFYCIKKKASGMQNMGKGLQKLFKAVVNELLEALPILGESGSAVSYLIP